MASAYFDAEPDVLTILELIDELEARLQRHPAVRAKTQKDGNLAAVVSPETTTISAANGTFFMSKSRPVDPGMLRSHMEQAGLATADVPAIFGITPTQVQDWLNGKRAIPSWVIPALQIFSLLTPGARRKLLAKSQPAGTANPSRKIHPFSRIEEL